MSEFIEQICKPLLDEYHKNADINLSKSMSAYMKNLFPFFGIQNPLRRKIDAPIIKQIIKNHNSDILDISNYLWRKNEREIHYFVIELLDKYKNKFEKKDISFIENLLITNSWWDSVDSLSSNICGEYFKKFPEQREVIIPEWSNSNNIWLIRSSILFQLKYKKETDSKLLFYLCEKHSDSKEFFIKKAIGWALRQYSYIAPNEVKTFVQNSPLQNLSKREALKHFSK